MFGVWKTKIYSKGVLNLPKGVLQGLGVKEGDYVTLTLKGDRVVVEKSKGIEAIRGIVGRKDKKYVEKNLMYLRGAYPDAEEFFSMIGNALSKVLGKKFVAERKRGKVLLREEHADIDNDVYVSYFENTRYPKGVFVLEAGNGRELVIKEDPDFSIEEAVQIGAILSKVITEKQNRLQVERDTAEAQRS